MRFILPLLLVSTVLLAQGTGEPELMGQAQRAYLSGDYESARELFGEVLQIDPRNTLAIQYLRNIALRQGKNPPAAHPEEKLRALIIPKVEVRDATFSAALDALKQAAEKLSVPVSFVSVLPAGQMQQPVTLSLANIPFTEALKYLCALNHATYKVEQYAIVISPATAAVPGASPAPSQ